MLHLRWMRQWAWIGLRVGDRLTHSMEVPKALLAELTQPCMPQTLHIPQPCTPCPVLQGAG